MPNGPFVDLSFSPNLGLVGVVRQFASEFYEQQLGPGDNVARIALATHEVLENAVKYSLDGLTRLRIEYHPGSPGMVQIRTWNRPRPEHLELLQKNMAELERAEDPLVYYLELMRRTSNRSDGSGLGLGRVRAEAEMTVKYAVEGEWVCVTAAAPFTVK